MMNAERGMRNLFLFIIHHSSFRIGIQNDECGTRNEESFSIHHSSFIIPHWSNIMAVDNYDLKSRTKAFALRIIRLYTALPKTTEAQVLGKQLLRSGTSVGAHYREADRAKSTPDFISKMEGGLQELDETDYWLELLGDSEIVPHTRLADLRAEANELIAIFVASVKTAKKNK
jgi:four helix bundle protein